MADSNISLGFSGGTGGSGGLTLGPPTNNFIAATEAAAEMARDAYAAANASWLPQYDASPTFTILLSWPAVPTNSKYQSRRGGAWADITGLVRGPRGVLGPQARFSVYCYANGAAAPAMPVGGSLDLGSGVLVVPANTTAAPTEPGAGQTIYRSQAPINPASDTSPVTPIWSTFAPLEELTGADRSADRAETAALEAQAYAAQAQTGADVAVGSPRGDLWTTSPTLPVADTNDSTTLSFGTNRWALSTEGTAAGFTAGGTIEEHLVVPRVAAPGAMGMFFEVVVGGVVVSNGILLFGFHRISRSDFPVLLKLYAGQDASDDAQFVNVDWRDQTLQLYGGDSTLSANTVVRISAAVVRGDPGMGMGGGLTTAQAQALINATPLSNLQGMVTDGQIPAAIMRDAELTSTAIIALITGNIAFSDIDGLIADAQVPASFMRDAELTLARVASALGLTTAEAQDILIGQPTLSGNDLTFTLADGSTETVTLPAGMGSMADGRLRFGMGVPANSLGVDGGAYLAVDTGGFYEKAAGAWTLQFTAEAAAAVGVHVRYAAASADAVFTNAEWVAGATSMTGVIIFPATAITHRKGFAIPADVASLTDIRVQGAAFNTRANYAPAVGNPDVLRDIGGVSHKTYIGDADDFPNDQQSDAARTFVLR